MTAPKWGGPWIGVVGTPVVGMFVLRATSTDSSSFASYLMGTALGAVLPGVTSSNRIGAAAGESALARYVFDPDTALYLDGGFDGSDRPLVAGTQTAVSALPAGFALTAVTIELVKSGTGDAWVQFSEAHELAYDFDPANQAYPAALPTMAALCAEGCGVRAVCGAGEILTVSEFSLGALYVFGTYEVA